MRVRNLTRKTTISQKARLCSSPASKALGLMGKIQVRDPLIFEFRKEARYSLHMLFVFCSIDILYLSKNKRVVDLKRDFRPFSLHKPKKPCLYIIELPAGAIKKSKTRIGDKIGF